MQDRVAASRTEAAAESPLLLSRPESGIALLTLNRPGQRNALSLELINLLTRSVDGLSADKSVHAVIVAANGPAFCAGHDLKELTAARSHADHGRAFYKSTMVACADMMQAILASPKPFIAAVEGSATAAGCQLVATCDLAVASKTAAFATPGVNIGLFCSTPMVALSRNVPRKRAMEMLLLGEMLSAKAAAEYGLVNRVVPPAAVRAEAVAMARVIASKSPLTVAIGKQAFYAQLERPVADAYAYTAGVMVENMLARDAAEGIGAFLDKRAPSWTGE